MPGSERGHELHRQLRPAFAVPAWTDAGGWTDPSQYATIRLADVNGDGSDERLGRNQDGLEVFRFDTAVGQWRPQVNAKNVRGKRRPASSVWDVVLHGGQTTKRIHELRRGRSRTFVTERVPLAARRRFCTAVVVTAPDTRAAMDRACSPVRAVLPAYTG